MNAYFWLSNFALGGKQGCDLPSGGWDGLNMLGTSEC